MGNGREIEAGLTQDRGQGLQTQSLQVYLFNLGQSIKGLGHFAIILGHMPGQVAQLWRKDGHADASQKAGYKRIRNKAGQKRQLK